jgi:hypothetical protein
MKPKLILQTLLLVLALFSTWAGGCNLVHAAEAARPSLSENESGYYYTIQKGDTLWDLSRRFSATPWVWPELWEENSATIANPHWIYPGQKIRLARRAGEPTGGAVTGDFSESSVAGIHYYFPLSDQYGFIRKLAVAPEGVIFKSQDPAKKMLSEGDIVYIRPEGNAALNKGQLMWIYRTFRPLIDQQTKELIGTQHLMCGVAEILQREPQYAIAKLIKSYRPIVVGDQLMPYQRRSPRIQIQASQPGIDGKLIMAEEHLNIFAESDVAFINRGRRQGVQPGQIYSIYHADHVDFGTVSPQPAISIPVTYGELLVLHTEDETATVLITSAKRELEEGIQIRTPLALR